MRFQINILFALSALLIGFTFLIGTVSAKWAHKFVVHNGSVYVISEEQVDPPQIGARIGKVTKFSGREGTYSGNFSNHYPKGTEYYAMIGVEIADAIAVKVKEELYMKATYGGEYAGSRYNWVDFLPYGLVAISVLMIGNALRTRYYR